MTKLVMTQRIFWPQYDTVEKARRLLDFFKVHPDLVDEISFFTEGDSLDWRYIPMDEVRRRAAHTTKVVGMTRAQGIRPAINILNTMGHGDEGGLAAPEPPFTRMVGMNGRRARYCACPADEAFLSYVTQKYRCYGECGAERYWIDDDVRLENHQPADWGCFCESCLADFSKTLGRRVDREGLIGDLEQNLEIRSLWIKRNETVIGQVLSAAAKGLREVNPRAGIGWMMGGHIHKLDLGGDLHRLFSMMGDASKDELWIRPGSGFWRDHEPRTLLTKANVVANASAHVSDKIKATHEVECYPYNTGDKSPTMTGCECMASLFAGRLDGLMFNVLDHNGNDLQATHGDWLSKLESWAPMLRKTHAAIAGTMPQGWSVAYSSRHMYQYPAGSGVHEMRNTEFFNAHELQLAGLPITAFEENAQGHILHGGAAIGMCGDELKQLLKKPLIMDGAAAQRYVELGLGESIGIRKIEARTQGMGEHFEEHALNASWVGTKRYMSMGYFNQTSYILDPFAGVETITSARDYREETQGTALSLYRPAGQAPVAVLGYVPWRFFLSKAKIEQLQNLSIAMLNQERVFRSTAPVVYWQRKGADKALDIFVNPSLETMEVAVLRTDAEILLKTDGVERTETAISLPPWGMCMVSRQLPA